MAVPQVTEITENLAAEGGVPPVGGRDPLAVASQQRIGQGVSADLGLLVVAVVAGGLSRLQAGDRGDAQGGHGKENVGGAVHGCSLDVSQCHSFIPVRQAVGINILGTGSLVG